SRTGGWCVSSCHGEPGARAGVATRAPASFFGGSGFSLGEDCAPARHVQPSNANTTIINLNWINGFMIYSFFSFPARVDFRNAGPEKAKNTARGNVPHLIRIRLTTSSFEEISTACQANAVRA